MYDKWSRRHWRAFLKRSGNVRAALMLSDSTIHHCNDPMPQVEGLTQAEFFNMLIIYSPTKYLKWKNRADRIARLYHFFRKRIPSVVVADVPYPEPTGGR